MGQATRGRYEPRSDSPDEGLVDPRGLGPGFWFEPMDETRADGGGAIHVAIWVPYEQAEARVAAALAAGRRMVRDEYAPAWWTLADAAGNEAGHCHHDEPRLSASIRGAVFAGRRGPLSTAMGTAIACRGGVVPEASAVRAWRRVAANASGSFVWPYSPPKDPRWSLGWTA